MAIITQSTADMDGTNLIAKQAQNCWASLVHHLSHKVSVWEHRSQKQLSFKKLWLPFLPRTISLGTVCLCEGTNYINSLPINPQLHWRYIKCTILWHFTKQLFIGYPLCFFLLITRSTWLWKKLSKVMGLLTVSLITNDPVDWLDFL